MEVRSQGSDSDPSSEKDPSLALQEKIHRQAIVAGLGVRALRGLDPQRLMEEATERVAQALDVPLAKILRVEPDATVLRLVAGVGWKAGLVGEATVSAGLDSQAGFTLASDHPVVVDDLATEARFRGPPLLHEHGVVSGLSVLIEGEAGRAWGVFGAHAKKRRRFTEDDVSFLQAVANVVAGATARAEHEAALATAKETLELHVEERTKELRRANAELEAFNYMVAHDLRAPLRSVEYLSRVAIEDYGDRLDDEGRVLLESMQKSTERMMTLVESLLNFARAMKGPIRREAVDLSGMSEEIFRELSGSRDASLKVEPGLRVEADPRLLELVLTNLLTNAVKFTRRTSDPAIEIGSARMDGSRAYFVADNGVGFDPAKASGLFTAFQRLHSSNDFEGTGVGLATVKRVVERHGGRVWAEGRPGAGAKFWFTLGEAAGGLPREAPPRRA